MLVTLLGWQGFKEEGLELASGYALLVEQKPKFKKLLAAAAPTASEADCLSVLPASWESLPETLRKAAYSDGVFPEEHPQFIRQNVLQVANMLPLRRSNSLVSKPKPLLPLPPAGQTNLGQRFLDLLLEGVGPQVSGSFSVPGLSIFPPARHSSAISLQSDSQGDTRLRARPPGLWPCKTHPVNQILLGLQSLKCQHPHQTQSSACQRRVRRQRQRGPRQSQCVPSFWGRWLRRRLQSKKQPSSL